MVPLDASVVDAIRTAIYSGRDTGGRFTLHHISLVPATMTADLSVHGRPPCCDSTHKTSAKDALLSAFLVLSHQNIPIDVLIDTNCLQTIVISERIATLLRHDGGKLRPENLVLTSGVDSVSYAVQDHDRCSTNTP